MTITDRFAALARAFRAPFRSGDGRFRTPPAAAAPVGEIAFADPRRLFPGPGNQRYAQYNPSALVGQQGLRVFDEMRRDDQVKAALAFKKYTVISTGWTIQSPEGQPADWEPTRFTRFVLENLDPNEIGSCTLDQDLYEILSALDYGYSVTEKIWQPIEDGEWAGHIGLRSLKTRAPHSILFAQDEFGNLAPDGVVQVTNRLTTGGRLPREKFVLFTYQSQFGNPYGTSDLEAAYFPWWIKHNASKWLAMLLEALGIPPVFGLYDPQRYTPAQIDELKKIFQNLQARTFGIIPKPGGTTAQGGGSTLDFWSPQLAGPAKEVFIPTLEHLDQRISRAILMPSLIGMTSDTSQGSFARSRVHFDVFLLVVEAIRKDLERIVMAQQIIRPLLDLNFPGLTDYPKWQLFPITDDVRLEILNRWNDLVSSRVVVPQEDDERHIRQLLKFPEKRPGTPEATGPTPPLPVPPTAPPPPAPMLTIAEGAIKVHVEAPPAPAVNVSVTPAPIAVDVAAPSAPPAPAITVNTAPITVEPAAVTIAEGAIQANVATPVTVAPADVTVAEGAVKVTVEPAAVTIAEGAIQTNVETPVTVAPADVTVAEGAVKVTVEAPPAPAITIEAPAMPATQVEKRIVRNAETGRPEGIVETHRPLLEPSAPGQKKKRRRKD